MTNKPNTPKEKTVTLDIETIRIKLNITKGEMAKRIGVSRTGYGLLSKFGGPRQIHMDTLTAILNSGVLKDAGMEFPDLFVIE